MKFLLFIYLPLVLLAFYILARLYFIYYYSQKDTVCKKCFSPDSERVKRDFWVQDILKVENCYKYWCRKCWNEFYVRNKK